MLARVVALLAVSAACYGQQEVPTFRAGTTLIEFTVSALDSKGKPITDLKKEEIQVIEEGQRRALAFFRLEGEIVAGSPQPLPPHIYSNRIEYTAGPPRNVTAILLDALNTPAADQISARDQALEYLRTLAPASRVAVYWLGADLRVVYDFTGDAESLRTRLAESFKKLPVFVSTDVTELDCMMFGRLSGSPCGLIRPSPAETAQYQFLAEARMRKTLTALEALGEQLAGIPGRKSMVWIGGGIPVLSIAGSGQIGDVNNGMKSFEAEIRKAAQRLASRNIAIYPVDSKGLIRGMVPPVAGKRSIANSILSNYMPESTNDILANLTGGRVVKWTNHLARGMEWAENDQRGSYSVGFYASGEPDNTWHNLTVRTTRRGVKLTHRQGFLSETAAAQPVEWTEAEWRAALANPIGSTAIHLDARFEALACQIKHGLLLQIAAADVHFRKAGERTIADLDVALADRAPDGGFSFRVNAVQLERSGDTVRYAHSWEIARGTSTVHLIVRDRSTGRFGTLDLPVK